jgi:hypothetical protein
VRGRTRNKCFTDLPSVYQILLYNYDRDTKQRELECRCLGAAFTIMLSVYAFRMVRGGCNMDGLGLDLCGAYVFYCLLLFTLFLGIM